MKDRRLEKRLRAASERPAPAGLQRRLDAAIPGSFGHPRSVRIAEGMIAMIKWGTIVAAPTVLAMLREAGFTTALAAPAEGVFRGSGALLNLGDGAPADNLLGDGFGQFAAFQRSDGGYPRSLMGAIALLRQQKTDDATTELIDLPGTHSLSAHSLEEHIAVDVIFGRMEGTAEPDGILAVLDATNLYQGLFLVQQLIDLERPIIVALTMTDAAEQAGIGVPYVDYARRDGIGIVHLGRTRTLSPDADTIRRLHRSRWGEPRVQREDPTRVPLGRHLGAHDHVGRRDRGQDGRVPHRADRCRRVGVG